MASLLSSERMRFPHKNTTWRSTRYAHADRQFWCPQSAWVAELLESVGTHHVYLVSPNVDLQSGPDAD
eukprot:3939567-Rhodomonas_salina.2